MSKKPIHVGKQAVQLNVEEAIGKIVNRNNESFYQISNVDNLRPFFMSVVSDSNHWMYISSNGGLSAGRKDCDQAIFPYYTDDKITESAEITGSKTIFQVLTDEAIYLWEPFSNANKGAYSIQRNLYKNTYGNKIIFEEINKDLGLIFSYEWNSSNLFGFVKKSTLTNTSDKDLNITVLDGIQNIVPYGVSEDLQNRRSNLVDAYKRSELDEDSGIGIFALSAIIVDKAEPSEALKATIAWSAGLENKTHLLSSLQLTNFRKCEPLTQETDIKAEKGAYFVKSDIFLKSKGIKDWSIVANVNQSVVALNYIKDKIIKTRDLQSELDADIDAGTKNLKILCNEADGLQLTSDKLRDSRHYSNTLFNIMRGGIFDTNYQIEKVDFLNYIAKANIKVFEAHSEIWNQLTDTFSLEDLNSLIAASNDSDFIRLGREYLPLKFSRRHGDPSRPWNRFSINTRSEIDGSKILDYEGNWRDIFQNWEALVAAYPAFIDSMIFKFVNATTFDGYNPYRVTKDGFDWEVIEPNDPWSYIGYWGDHQIIYLQKFLEISEHHYPGRLAAYLDTDTFVYANVPYKIKSYEETLNNPKDTIDFDHEEDEKINKLKRELGADGALLKVGSGDIYSVNLLEKLLSTLLAKLSNFIPEGGIWLNTQRPEWNDANNALVGNGVSMVTLYYLRRFLNFLNELLNSKSGQEILISKELMQFFNGIASTFENNQNLLKSNISDKDRKLILDGLGKAGSAYRLKIYKDGFSNKKVKLPVNDVISFIENSLKFIDHTIDANRREDALYHAYNLMTLENKSEISIAHLPEMLEGQVAVLSANYLSAEQSLDILNAMKSSALFREDQQSYLLYPNKELPRFLVKNNIRKEQVESSALLKKLITEGNSQIIEMDVHGNCHFNSNFNNAKDLERAIEQLENENAEPVSRGDKIRVLEIFEEVFNHKAFTGRSGTFFGYEGLGSIYWHMVSKLVLAVQETCLRAINTNENEAVTHALKNHYYEMNEGIGIHKTPQQYGAIPTDPYSHTPAGKGAQQPGMTGQVKEDILSRFGELGIQVDNGSIKFNFELLNADEFIKESSIFTYFNVINEQKEITVPENALCFTYCQVPVIYKSGEKNSIQVRRTDGSVIECANLDIGQELSSEIFNRTHAIELIEVILNK